MPPVNPVTSLTRIPVWLDEKIVPLLPIPCKKVAMLNALMALADAEILPLLVIPTPLVLPKSPTLPTLMPWPVVATILPLLPTTPLNVETFRRLIPSIFAEIVPALPMPPAALPLPNKVIEVTLMPSPFVATTLPLLLMPPRNVEPPETKMPFVDAAIVPLLAMPPAKVETPVAPIPDVSALIRPLAALTMPP